MSFLRRNDPKIPPARNDDAQYESNRAALLGTGGGNPVSWATLPFRITLINIRIVAIVFPLAPVLNVHPAIMAQVMDDTAVVMPTATVTATLDPRMGVLATRLPAN
jgi:hypothetical protein